MAGKKSEKRGPKGMDMLWNYNALIAFFFLFLLFATDFALLFGQLVRDTTANLLQLFYFVCFMTILFSLTYKRPWAYHFIVVCYAFWIANAFISFLRINAIENPMARSFYVVIAPLYLFFVFLDAVVLWYVYEKHEFLIKRKGRHDMVDKVFRRVLVLFYVGLFFFLGFVIIQRAEAIPMYKTMEEKIEYKDSSELADFCNSLKDENVKDMCEIYTIKNYGELPKRGVECSDIDSSLRRFDCYRLRKHAG